MKTLDQASLSHGLAMEQMLGANPRWTAYDAAFFGESIPGGAPARGQERACTLPIWYHSD